MVEPGVKKKVHPEKEMLISRRMIDGICVCYSHNNNNSSTLYVNIYSTGIHLK